MNADKIIDTLEMLQDGLGVEDPEVLYDLIEDVIADVEIMEELWAPKRIP